METKKSQILFSPRAWICAIFDHRLEVSKDVTEHIKEYRCARCKQEMTDTAQGFIAKLTPKLKETNSFLAKYYERRCSYLKFHKDVLSKAS